MIYSGNCWDGHTKGVIGEVCQTPGTLNFSKTIPYMLQLLFSLRASSFPYRVFALSSCYPTETDLTWSLFTQHINIGGHTLNIASLYKLTVFIYLFTFCNFTFFVNVKASSVTGQTDFEFLILIFIDNAHSLQAFKWREMYHNMILIIIIIKIIPQLLFNYIFSCFDSYLFSF